MSVFFSTRDCTCSMVECPGWSRKLLQSIGSAMRTSGNFSEHSTYVLRLPMLRAPVQNTWGGRSRSFISIIDEFRTSSQNIYTAPRPSVQGGGYWRSAAECALTHLVAAAVPRHHPGRKLRLYHIMWRNPCPCPTPEIMVWPEDWSVTRSRCFKEGKAITPTF